MTDPVALAALFQEVLLLSSELRGQYVDTLGKPISPNVDSLLGAAWNAPKPPVLASTIYNRVLGTPHRIQDQKHMDFIPGFRLIHINELAEAYRSLGAPDGCFPILADYGGNFICLLCDVSSKSEQIANLDRVEGLEIQHNTPEAFLETVRRFYLDKVYFLDSDGYLDFDFERQGAVGREVNPDLAYWD